MFSEIYYKLGKQIGLVLPADSEKFTILLKII